MKQKFIYFLLLFLSPVILFSQDIDSAYIRSIYNEALQSGKSYGWLDFLSNKIGARLSGSPGAEKAVAWAEEVFTEIGVEARKQECMVPRWVRGGKEQAFIIINEKTKIEVPVCALGGSIETGKTGVVAEVVEVKDFEELEKLGNQGKIQDKIVFYNGPMNPAFYNTFEAYGNAVNQRWAGAMRAAPFGAVGVVVRSMTLSIDDYPHTGSMGYADSIKKIPACAISTKGAEQLSKIRRENQKVKFAFYMTPKTYPDVLSYNVIGEIKGTTYPEEIITVGGHLDSWDLGDGAHDDGAGCVQAAEVLYLLKRLNIQPKRTIRAVMFMNEENGGRGGLKYAAVAKEKKEKHIAAIESDAGGFSPRGFSFKGDSLLVERLLRWEKYFAPYGTDQWFRGWGGADINHLDILCPKLDCLVLIGLSPDSQRYFDYHHAANDTFDKINKRELALGSAAMAALVYLLAEHGIK